MWNNLKRTDWLCASSFLLTGSIKMLAPVLIVLVIEFSNMGHCSSPLWCRCSSPAAEELYSDRTKQPQQIQIRNIFGYIAEQYCAGGWSLLFMSGVLVWVCLGRPCYSCYSDPTALSKHGTRQINSTNLSTRRDSSRVHYRATEELLMALSTALDR